MNREMVDRIVHAVLYEGYILYPYRPSVKDRQRWTFGGLFPEAWCAVRQNGDASTMQVECLIRCVGNGAVAPIVDVVVRFLHLVNRTHIEQPQRVWQEAGERQVKLDGLSLQELETAQVNHAFTFPHSVQPDPPMMREQQAIAGSISVLVQPTNVPGCYRLTVRIGNDTSLDNPADRTRDDALLRSFASTHVVLCARDGTGEFVSMTDPPAECCAAAAACQNIGSWPILVGADGDKDTILSSPIILSDYPQVAPESPGDLFDGTEIDEILTLRIMALSDDEKREMASIDDRAKALLERTESLTREQLMSLHGTLRDLRPISTGDAS